jgi:hypothetical protein
MKTIKDAGGKQRSLFMCAIAALTIGAMASSSSAYVMDLIDGLGEDSGWSVEIPDEFGSVVEITVDDVDLEAGTITIEKGARFFEIESLPVLFRQDEADSPITKIIIADELLVNSTSDPWIGFRMQLVGFGAAEFDPAESAGFDVDPFTDMTFSNGNKTVTIHDGGVVPVGGIWTPGLTPLSDGGELVINVTPATGEPLVQFFLKETPIIPEPATVALVALGAIALVRRRR